MTMGAVPYRDIIDINMPLTYDIHAAVVAIGGMSDVAWRVFDLTAAAVMSALILLLVGPAGRVAVPASFGHKVTLARDDFDRSGRRRRSVSSVRNVGGSGRIERLRQERA